MFVYAGRVMLSGLIIMWFFAWAENQFVRAGPLAEAVEKAKAAAGVTDAVGVTDEKAASEQGVGREGFQPPLVPAARSEPPQPVEASTVSVAVRLPITCLLYTSPSPRDGLLSRMPSSA